MRTCTYALMCAKHRDEYDLYFYASSPTIVALAAKALIRFASLLRLQSLAMSSIFVVYAVCANKFCAIVFAHFVFDRNHKFAMFHARKMFSSGGGSGDDERGRR